MSKLEESQPKGTITIVPDDHGDKGQASRDYVIQEISNGNCQNFAIEFAPEYKLSGLVAKINSGKATDEEIDNALEQAPEYSPMLKEALKQNKNKPGQCIVTEWKAHRNDSSKSMLENDKDNAKNIESQLSSDTPMLLLSGVDHVSNLAGLLKQNGHDVGFVTAHYKDENTSLYPEKQVKGVSITEVQINKKARTIEKRPSIHTKESYQKTQWQDTTKKKVQTVTPELASAAKNIGDVMNNKSNNKKSNPSKQQNQQKSSTVDTTASMGI